MNLLTKGAILGANDLQTVDVPVPEWGGPVRVRTLTALERVRFNEANTKAGLTDMAAFQGLLVIATVVDEAGQPIFDASDLEALNQKSSAAVDRVFQKAIELNGMGNKAVDDAEKESAVTQASGSDSN